MCLLSIFLCISKDLNEFYKLAIESFLALITTSAGIFIPLLINRNWQKEDDRRILAFTISSLWNELRGNMHILEQTKMNFQFSQIQQITIINLMIETILMKFVLITKNAQLLNKNSFYAAQNSGSFRKFDDDKSYNLVLYAYENLDLLQSRISIAEGDLYLKRYLSKQMVDPLTNAEEILARKQISESFDKLYQELNFAINSVTKAVDQLNIKMTQMGLKIIYEDRVLDSTLRSP
jgi:hypothetical protein